MKIKTEFNTYISYKLAVKLCQVEGCDIEQIEWCLGKDCEEEFSNSKICSSAYLDRIYSGDFNNDEEI